MKKLFIALFCFFISLNALAASHQTKITRYLYIQNAKSATIKAIPKKRGYYQITLSSIQPRVIYFTKRPKRSAGYISIRRFLKDWGKNKHGTIAPNAGITGLINNRSVTYPVVLYQPQYNAKRHTLTYPIHPLVKGQHIPKSIILKHVSMLVDSVCASCALF